MRTVRVFNHHVHTVYYVLAVLEALLFFLAFHIGAYLYFEQSNAGSASYVNETLFRAALFALIMVSSLSATGLYKPHLREGSSGILLRLMSAFVIAILAVALVFYLMADLHLWRGVFAQSVIIALLMALLSRWLFNHVVDNNELKTRVLVLGAGQRANTAVSRMRRTSDRQSFEFVAFVRAPGEVVQIVDERVVELDEDELTDFVLAEDVDQIVVAMDDRRRALPVDQLVECRLDGVEVVEVATFFEREAGKIMLDFFSPSWLVFSDGFSMGSARRFTKRLFDILASFALLMVAWPLMLITLFAIWIEDGFSAPVIYRQRRVGLYGREFDLMKLRSMRVDAEGDGKARWAARNDNRITRVGAIIRRLRIDELPQILNVLYGDMSLVGPRPERPEFVHELEEKIPYYPVRHQVKPGIAGWAQLRYPYGASEEDAREKLQYELYYIKNHSLFLDCMIILATTEIVLFGQGVR
ncbi:MAG: TIGR03013 family XrtA/PEP-CTERM system glycosyltransferase [Parahaliea sp.]